MIIIKNIIRCLIAGLVCISVLSGCATNSIDNEDPDRADAEVAPATQSTEQTESQTANTAPNTSNPKSFNQSEKKDDKDEKDYSLLQAIDDNAQLKTIAFSGLAFITGSAGADTFFPPGKVADYFGFQYMRDIDQVGYGHNTTFLSKAAMNVLYILDDNQKEMLVNLAKEQAPLYTEFAYNRFPLMNAFRRCLEGDLPDGASELDADIVSEYTGRLYGYDAQICYGRAVAVGNIISSFTDDQKAYLEKMEFDDSSTWPSVSENEELKKGLTNAEYVAVMTYASELFSWYKGSLDADIYFCPERHGTYFGGFFMKDYPAMGDPDYFISTSVTGESGEAFLNILSARSLSRSGTST